MRTEQLLHFSEHEWGAIRPYLGKSCSADLPDQSPTSARCECQLWGWEMFSSLWHLGQASREPRMLQVSRLQWKYLWVQLPFSAGHIKSPRKTLKTWSWATSETTPVKDIESETEWKIPPVYILDIWLLKKGVSVKRLLSPYKTAALTNKHLRLCSTGSALLHRKWGAQLKRSKDKGGYEQTLAFGIWKAFCSSLLSSFGVCSSFSQSYPQLLFRNQHPQAGLAFTEPRLLSPYIWNAPDKRFGNKW